MLTFEYSAKDARTGHVVKERAEAMSANALSKKLVSQGLSPLEIHPAGTKSNLFKRFKQRVTARDKVIFSRQLSTLLNAGLPLSQSLRTVQEQIDNQAFALIISEVIIDIEGGTAFAKALEKHPKVFNNVFVSLVTAGEASGTLDAALEKIATQQEKDAELLAKVRGAMVYPIIVLVVILGVVVFMLTTVLPQVELLYQDLNKSLPFVTAVMIGISHIITKFWWVILIAIGVGIYFLKRYLETEAGRKMADHLLMDTPVLGKLFRKVYMARFCRTGATLMSSGVPMLEMLRITSTAVNNVHVEASVMKAAEQVKGGKALSESLKGDTNFLTLVPQMIRIGEQSGAIDKMMNKAATFYENEIDNEVKAISTTIEPVLMVVLALVAGLMVSAILIPIYGLVGENLAL